MKLNQAKFFDIHPPVYPWPKLLRKEGFARVYKPRDAKFKKILDGLKMRGGEQVLDVGCGDGVLLERIVKTYGVCGTGVDISPLSIKRARANSNRTIKFLIAKATNLPFSDMVFDIVLGFDVLEHIKDQGEVLSEIVRVLKPKGKLLIYTLNKNQKFTWNWWLDKLGVDVYEGYAHDPSLFLNPYQTKKQLEKAGLVIKRLELFNSFFTLATDEMIMILVSLFSKLGLFKRETKSSLILGRIFLAVANFFSPIFLPFLEILDKPWIKKGYSNSFFLLAQKRES
jgi:ubiquinone/menaquinone biosynthesis C-methylase UbiE